MKDLPPYPGAPLHEGKTIHDNAAGAGPAGAFFSFLLKRAGAARVLASDKSRARLAYGRHVGTDISVDASTGDFTAAVMDATAAHHMLPIEQVGEGFQMARDRTDDALKVSIKF